jgi:hypothetical protein
VKHPKTPEILITGTVPTGNCIVQYEESGEDFRRTRGLFHHHHNREGDRRLLKEYRKRVQCQLDRLTNALFVHRKSKGSRTSSVQRLLTARYRVKF